jgi:PTH1 family peptidyl-tRNA hydrolase
MLRDLLRRLFGRPRAPSVFERLTTVARENIRLVVGLGNPGTSYAESRHNLGFRCVDELARAAAASWEDAGGHAESLVTLAPLGTARLVLAKPRTYMNASGRAVRDLLEVIEVDLSQVLVLYDDMDLPLGSLRLRERGSPGTHNGMRSVVSELGTDQVPRLRIGIGQAGAADARDYVLSEFTADESRLADAAVAEAVEAVSVWATAGATAAMNRFNSGART